MTAYFFYLLERRPSLKKEKPDLGHLEIVAEMGAEWNKMPEADKAKYIQMAAEDRKRYEREKAAYDAKTSSEKGKK
jgi:hypothetical protein